MFHIFHYVNEKPALFKSFFGVILYFEFFNNIFSISYS